MQPSTDRRPIASRNLPIWQRTAAALARARISPNAISVCSIFFAALGAAALFATPYVPAPPQRLLFLAAAAGIQLRLLANMLDGMVALSRPAPPSPLGDLFNELPDRLSDSLLLIAAGYAATSLPTLGWAAALLALFITYLRAFAKNHNLPGLFIGPMAKSHRMFTLTLATLIAAAYPIRYLFTITMAIILFLGVITALRRLARLVSHLRHQQGRSPG